MASRRRNLDGALIAEDRSGTLLYEIRIGPFDTMAAAQHAAEMMRQSFELSPILTVENGEP